MIRARAWVLALVLVLLPVSARAGIDDEYVKPGGGSWGADWFKPIFQGDEFGKSYALVMGIGNYDFYSDLSAPANDAIRVRDFLKESGFDEIVTLTDDMVTFDRVNSLMEDVYPAKLKPRDRFLFFISGHGEIWTQPSGSKRGYLVLKEDPDSVGARCCR